MNPGEMHRHDLRNQLNIILGFTALLLADSRAGDPRHAELEEIHLAATASLELVARAFPAEE